MAITTKITFWVICLLYISAMMSNLNIMPNMNTQPIVNTTEFANVAEPGEHKMDPWIGPWELIWSAVSALLNSFWMTFFVFGTIRQYGFPIEYAATGQALVLALFGYDMFAIWKGYEII